MKLARQWLTDRLAVSGALGTDELRTLRAEGFRSVIDLRSDGEPRPQGLAPWEEAKVALECGLSYRQIPVEPPLLCDALGHEVARVVGGAAAPVLLHCTSGRRAGTFGLMLLARWSALTVEDCLARGRALGLDFEEMPRLTAFLRRYVERHTGRDRTAVRLW